MRKEKIPRQNSLFGICNVGYTNLVESNYFYNNRKHVSNKKGPDADYCKLLINTDGRYVVLGLGDRKNLRNLFL